MPSFRGFSNDNPNMNPNINSNMEPIIDPNLLNASFDPNIDPGFNASPNPSFDAGFHEGYRAGFHDGFNAGSNPDPNPAPNPGPDSSTGANPSTTSTATDSTATDPTSQGSDWRPNGEYRPQNFADPNKRLCSCPNHLQRWWPTEHAELIISPCAYICPFCDDFNRVGRERLMASNLRRHITKTHIEGDPSQYGTLAVARGGSKPRGQ
ncbi:hypothetical protein N7455_012241 [Penicillium solitum]|uniref:uncharacterized protein n=1 Tax=Penicillium solitum TaxID=60172 RepID=UPI0032C4A5D1|nr:hypothetical protein N7455_012241 [Penicillium solitum]